MVADFTLPYPAAEADAAEPEDPPLTRPPYRPPLAAGGGIRVVKPLDRVVKDRFLVEREVFQKDLDVQRAGVEGLVKGVFVPSNAVTPKPPRLEQLTNNRYLDLMAGELAHQRDRVQELQGLMSDPGLADPVREQVGRDLDRVQMDLAGTLGVVAEQFVASGIEVGSPAGTALRHEMTSSLSTIQHAEAKKQIGTKLRDVQANAGDGAGAGAVTMLNGLRRIGGF